MPTANGRLSFRHVGDTSYPSVCKYTNFVDDRNRFVAGHQKRQLSDLLFRRITATFSKRTGDFWFAVFCRSVPETGERVRLDALEGEVCIFKSKWDWKSFASREGPLKLIDEMNYLRLKSDFECAIDRFNTWSQLTSSEADIKVHFNLSRNGIIRLGKPIFKDQSLAKNSEIYSNNMGVTFGRWVSNQAYFFLRDICHYHQHHSPSEDTILILQDEENKEQNWRDNVLYSLQHYVIKLRRTVHVEDLHRALGILAYAQAFKGICEVASGGDGGLQKFQFDAIAASIRARIDELDSTVSRFAQTKSWAISKSASYRGALLGGTAVAVSVFITFLQPYMRSHEDAIARVGQEIVDHFTQIATTAAAVLGGLWAFFSENTFRRTSRRPGWAVLNFNFLYFRDIAAVSVFRPRTVGLLLLAVAALIFALVIYR